MNRPMKAMKMKKTDQLKLAAVTALSIMALAGCDNNIGSVPGNYQGVFQDTQNGVELDMSGNAVQLKIGTQTTLQGAVSPITYEKLAAGTPGFYTYIEHNDQTDQNSNTADVFFVVPNASTKQEAGDVVYMTSAVVYMTMNMQQNSPVQSITITYSPAQTVSSSSATPGEIELDADDKTPDDSDPGKKGWEVGPSATSVTYTLVRTASSSNFQMPSH